VSEDKKSKERTYFSPGAVAAGWWYSQLNDSTGAGRMARAKLRRCNTPAEAILIPETIDLFRRLVAEIDKFYPGKQGEFMKSRLKNDAGTLGMMAILLAEVRDDTAAKVPDRLQNTFSAMRFQTLMRITDPYELIQPMRRALRQIKSGGNVTALAGDLFDWGHPERGERTRSKWCFAYYGSASAAPAYTNNTDSEIIE
jgi:CRISPR system Cascade subunit CasB